MNLGQGFESVSQQHWHQIVLQELSQVKEKEGAEILISMCLPLRKASGIWIPGKQGLYLLSRVSICFAHGSTLSYVPGARKSGLH